ncbi:2-hydroxyacid dehydrogenase [Luteolibacter yonseiensis]|uniref:2-hydroxyacid dehydrogenase n=1 Tax=Luteolibacter yonseiensis TaxID=1144680 RepID=A0A934V9H8_9BACT|nr:2-hydroxyacid dehydrogenase [Luteolibacter yonseiensis]MBK1814190.1 2-hydroxyacid dehydrogenase [Luteolibacter yonseiensis]
MKVTVFSTKPYDEQFLRRHNQASNHELVFIENRLTSETAALAEGSPAICAFVNDELNARTLAKLAAGGTRFVALRCAGFNNVDLAAAEAHCIQVARVPAYSPHAVAEHAVALLLCLNRHVHKAYNRVREGNFSIDGLMGEDLHGKTVGVVGTGTIGAIFAGIMRGFGCEVLAYDVVENPDCLKAGVRYVSQEELFSRSNVISLHCPLMPQTHHLIDGHTLAGMRDGVFIINTSRGALIDTEAATAAIKSGRIGGLALDVYEEESELFFDDHSDHVIQDDVFMRLTTFPNVLITGHQAFFTNEAMTHISMTTFSNLADFENGRDCPNLVKAKAN